jgi:hypothetical protein
LWISINALKDGGSLKPFTRRYWRETMNLEAESGELIVDTMDDKVV